ncbi:MAG: PhoU domain-containing protein, partial [Pseudomonadota bacterium]|nr:PhoU domain-containing protein [Pseudomonadota bacterium]
MRIPRNIRDNFRFLIAEVESQVSHLRDFFATPSISLGRRILDRSGYAYNLKMRIHDSCLNKALGAKGIDASALSLRGMESIATDLERITELCRDCVHQMKYLQCEDCLQHGAYTPMLEQVIEGVGMIENALQQSDTRQALKIGRVEQKLDKAYEKLRKRYTRQLKRTDHTEDLISALFVAHSVEQMGDALLNVSEAIVSINLGQPVNIDRYHSMKASVEHLGADSDLSNLVIRPIAETRSGSAISGISAADQEEVYVAIYKDGKKRKLKEEREGVESWHEIFPGLAPRILSYKKRGQSAALLIEHLAG